MKIVEGFTEVKDKINYIKIRGNLSSFEGVDGMYANYDEEDQIFYLEEEVKKDELEKISAECKSCGKPHPKMKNW